MQIIALLELTAKCGREQDRDRGFAGPGNTHDNSDHWFGYGVCEGRGPHALRFRINSHHPFLRHPAPASTESPVESPPVAPVTHLRGKEQTSAPHWQSLRRRCCRSLRSPVLSHPRW